MWRRLSTDPAVWRRRPRTGADRIACTRHASSWPPRRACITRTQALDAGLSPATIRQLPAQRRPGRRPPRRLRGWRALALARRASTASTGSGPGRDPARCARAWVASHDSAAHEHRLAILAAARAARAHHSSRLTKGVDRERREAPPRAVHRRAGRRRRRPRSARPGAHGRRHRPRARSALRRDGVRLGHAHGCQPRSPRGRLRTDAQLALRHSGRGRPSPSPTLAPAASPRRWAGSSSRSWRSTATSRSSSRYDGRTARSPGWTSWSAATASRSTERASTSRSRTAVLPRTARSRSCGTRRSASVTSTGSASARHGSSGRTSGSPSGSRRSVGSRSEYERDRTEVRHAVLPERLLREAREIRGRRGLLDAGEQHVVRRRAGVAQEVAAALVLVASRRSPWRRGRGGPGS